LSVSPDHSVGGIGDKSKKDSNVITNWPEKKEAKNDQLLSEMVLPPSNQQMDYLFEYLSPNIILTLRSLSKLIVQAKRYKMTF